MKENEKLEFHGGIFSAVLPFILFIASCIVFFVILQYYEMIALALGAFVALIIGSLLSKNWSKYWDAVVGGMSQPLINTLALIFIVVGIIVFRSSILLSILMIVCGLFYVGGSFLDKKPDEGKAPMV